MKVRSIIGYVAVVAFMLPGLAVHGLALQSNIVSITASEYRQQLKAIADRVNELGSHPESAGELVTSIPDTVSITTSAGEVTVNNKTLKDSLAAFASANEQKRPGLLREIETYTQAMSRAADDYENRGTDTAPQHAHLDQILARPEFKKVKEPNAKDALLSRIYRWLSKLLDKLSFHGGSNFDVMRVLVYIFAGAAIIVLLLWTIQRLR